jgi:predicted Zn-dependent protease
MNQLGAEAYEEILSQAKIITGTPEADLVKRVGGKIAEVTGKDYDWRFNLIDDDGILNAFCLPGGKVAVYSGILKVTEDETGLAVVLGHEIAHATLQHGNERMSQPMYKRVIGMPVGITTGIWGSISPGSRKVVMDSFGLGYVVGSVMPYSQQNEIEADEVGLRYMMEAGYDIDQAPVFWERMQAATPNAQPSDMLSSHPDSEKRAEDLRREIAELKKEKETAK